MPEAANIRECKKLINRLERQAYFSVALAAYNEKLAEIHAALMTENANEDIATRTSFIRILPCLHDVMRSAQDRVEEYIQSKVTSGEITNADQARKSAAGNIFQQFFAYTLAKNIVHGNITVPVVVTTSVKNIINEYAAIQVDDDIQFPDSDVIVYSSLDENSPILNFSCKTSCRERAGQTYKWKLLCDLATCHCDHMEGNVNCPATRYRLRYVPTQPIITCFVTADFYSELNNPQISGLFHFFDYSYIAKQQSPDKRIQPLQTIIHDINEVFATNA